MKKEAKQIGFHIETIAIDLIDPHPKNSRYITEQKKELLKYSLEKFSLLDKPIVNTKLKGRYGLIAGHKRMEIQKEKGAQFIEVQVPDRRLNKKEVEELLLLHNNASGEYNFDELQTNFELSYLLEMGFDQGDFKIEIEPLVGGEDDYEVPEKIKTNIKLGDFFELKKGKLVHKIACGDGREEQLVQKLLDGKIPTLMVTDPPYGVEYDPSWRNKAGINKSKGRLGKVKNDDIIEWTEAYRHSNAPVAYVWHAGKYSNIVLDNLISVGYQPISQIIWNKDQFALSRGDYHWKHEPCWYVHQKGKKHNWKGGRAQSTVWDIPKVDRNEKAYGHGTQKPVEAMARPIRNNSSKGNLIYDPFSGSGTTMVAAHGLGRSAYCIDLDPKWCQVTIERMLQLDDKIEVYFKGKKVTDKFKKPVIA